jgi:hypothetical protein
VSFIIFSSGFEEQRGKRRLHDPYLSNLSRSGHFGSIFPLFFLFFPFFFLSQFSFFLCQFPPTRSSPLSSPLSSCSTFIHDLNSLSRVQQVFFAGFGLNFCWEEGGRERHAAEHAVVASRLWEKEGSPSLSPCIYTSHKLRWGVWGWVRCVLVCVLVCLKPVLPLPLSSLGQSDLFPQVFN